MSAAAPAPRRRHARLKLAIHRYICPKCGMGTVNDLDPSNHWRKTFYTPDGRQHVSGQVPPCVEGPLTVAYLKKYWPAIVIAGYAKGPEPLEQPTAQPIEAAL